MAYKAQKELEALELAMPSDRRKIVKMDQYRGSILVDDHRAGFASGGGSKSEWVWTPYSTTRYELETLALAKRWIDTS